MEGVKADKQEILIGQAQGLYQAALRDPRSHIQAAQRLAITQDSLTVPASRFTKESLVYDLQEPFRWIGDVTVMEAFESEVLDLPDFYFTGDDYRYRFEPEAKQRFLDLIRERFNSAVGYRGRVLKWDTVIERKALELGRYLLGRSGRLDFLEPSPKLARSDDRERIVALSESGAQRSGITRSTFYHLRRKAKSERSFKVHASTRMKLELKKRR
jgi:CRISP-associated protein Cas1